MAVTHKQGTPLTCECGQPATTRRINTMICARCATLGERAVPFTGGTRARPVPHYGWLELRHACNDFLARAGLSTTFQ